MKNILKKTSLILLILILAFSTILITGCKNDDNKNDNADAQAFYDYAVEAKVSLDDLAETTCDGFYTLIYNPSGIDLGVYRTLFNNILKEGRATVQEKYNSLAILYNKAIDSSLYAEVKNVMYAFEDYADCVFAVEGSYTSFSSNVTQYKRELRDALLDLEFALSK